MHRKVFIRTAYKNLYTSIRSFLNQFSALIVTLKSIIKNTVVLVTDWPGRIMFVFSQGSALSPPRNRVKSRRAEFTMWFLSNVLINKLSSFSPWFSLLSCWRPQSYSQVYLSFSGLVLSVQRELGNRNAHPWAQWHRNSPHPWKVSIGKKWRSEGGQRER